MYLVKRPRSNLHGALGRKKSIFFNLPYWSKLQVRHCIDVMHIEKNVMARFIGN